MLFDVDNVNRAESHMRVRHILKNIHGTYPIFQEKSIENGLMSMT